MDGFAVRAKATAANSQAAIQALPPQGTKARKPSKPSKARAYKLKLKNTMPTTIRPPEASHQRDGPRELTAKAT